jgi:metal-sulfur cluster biosynthetic enzyme
MIASREEELMEALRSVIDPEIGMNIVELGLIRDLDFDDEGKAKVTMILTTPFCPYGPQIIEQVRVVTHSVTGNGGEVEIGTELWDPSMMEEGAGGDWGLF